VQSISCLEARWPVVKRAACAGAMPLALVATLVLAADSRVPYVPTPQGVVERMLDIAKVGPSDYIIDLGSGDGRIVITAASKHGARGFGVDLNPERIKESNDNARRAGVTDKVAFYQRNLFETDLSQASVITMYLLPRVNLELRPKLLELKPGTRLVSHDFDMGDWRADTHIAVKDEDKYGGAGGTSDIYFWVVPAKAEGTWNWQGPVAGKPRSNSTGQSNGASTTSELERGKPQTYEIRLDQKHQVITGSVWVGGRTATLQGASLRGTEITFQFTTEVNGSPVKHEYSGKIDGGSINGTVAISGPRVHARSEWNAVRGTRPAEAGTSTPVHAARPHGGATN